MRGRTVQSITENWFKRGRIETLGNLDCFVIDLAGDASATPVIWLHGFPSSSLDWRAVIDLLVTRHGNQRRMLALDFPGFGWSAKPKAKDYSYSLIDQADRVVLMLRNRGIDRIHLIAHDMGTSVACELLARREAGLLPLSIESLLLTNGSIYIDQARLTPSQKLLRSPLAGWYTTLASWPLFRWQITRILTQPIDEDELRAMWELMQYNNGLDRLKTTIRYIDERYLFYRRWTDPLKRLDLPVRIVWGRRDPVAVAAIGERLARTMPTAEAVWLDDCGHFPMLEDPSYFAQAVHDFL